jgi:hypothetical protein
MPRKKLPPNDHVRRELVLRFVALADELNDLYDAVVSARESGALTRDEEREALSTIDLCVDELEEARPRLTTAARSDFV